MPMPSNPGLRNLRDASSPSGLRPLAQSSFSSNIPAGYTSPDVIDLRNAPHHPILDKIGGLVQAVKDDYHDSFPAPLSLTPFGPGESAPTYGTDASTTLPPQTLQRRVVR